MYMIILCIAKFKRLIPIGGFGDRMFISIARGKMRFACAHRGARKGKTREIDLLIQ